MSMLSLWKYTLELASKELDLLKKKKQALDDLFSSQRISQATYEHLSREVDETLADVEKYLETTISKMKSRMEDLEKQIGILEIFLANVEMLHATNEIDDEAYEKQSKALSLGIESVKYEIEEIKNALERTTSKPAPAEAEVTEYTEETVTPQPSETPISEPSVEAETSVEEMTISSEPSSEEKTIEPMFGMTGA